jgi:periplasmic protein TonB
MRLAAFIAFSVAAVFVVAPDNATAQRNRRAQTIPDQVAPVASDAPKESARIAGRTASVILEFTIAADGTTQDIVVVESSDPAFDHVAIESLARWRYEPKMEDGRPVERRGVKTKITFVLED